MSEIDNPPRKKPAKNKFSVTFRKNWSDLPPVLKSLALTHQSYLLPLFSKDFGKLVKRFFGKK